MKKNPWIVSILVFLIFSACAPVGAPTHEAKPELPAATQIIVSLAPTRAPTLEAKSELPAPTQTIVSLAPTRAPTLEAKPELSVPTQTMVSSVLKYHPLNTMTHIEEIDLVLTAVASGDAQKLRDLFGFTKTACMTVSGGLGGPPPCGEGGPDGTIVEVLPFLGPEGSYLRKEEINNFPGLNVIGVYAVYQVSDTAYSEENFPAGDYGIMLVAPDNLPGVILQIKARQIIRIDYIFDPSSFDVVLQRDASAVVLNPNLK